MTAIEHLIDVLAQQIAMDYLTSLAAQRNAEEALRTEHANLPPVELAA